MKKIMILFLLLSAAANAQKEMPAVTLKSETNGKSYNVKNDFSEKNKLYVFAFWATWCVPCINELDAINDNYAKWSKELNMELVAISVDDARTQKRIKGLVAKKNWPYTVLLDANQEVKKALKAENVPYTVVVKNKKVIYIHNGYDKGGEVELYKKLKQLK